LSAQDLDHDVSSDSSPLVVDLPDGLGQADLGDRDPLQGSVELPVATTGSR
jgi:hypothetical protein